MLHAMRVDMTNEHEHIAYPVECVENMPRSMILLLTRPNVNHTLCGPFNELMTENATLRVETDSFCNRYTTQPGHCFIKGYSFWNDTMHIAIGIVADPIIPDGSYWTEEHSKSLFGQVQHIATIVADYAASHQINSVYFPWNGLFINYEELAEKQEDREVKYCYLSKAVGEIMSEEMPNGVILYHVLPKGFVFPKPITDKAYDA